MTAQEREAVEQGLAEAADDSELIASAKRQGVKLGMARYEAAVLRCIEEERSNYESPAWPGEIVRVLDRLAALLAVPAAEPAQSSEREAIAEAAGVERVAQDWIDERRRTIANFQRIAQARGRYSRDPLTHAGNAIDAMRATALAALKDLGVEPWPEHYQEPDADETLDLPATEVR